MDGSQIRYQNTPYGLGSETVGQRRRKWEDCVLLEVGLRREVRVYIGF